MKIRFFLFAIILTFSLALTAQTLFTYGNKKVEVQEFTRALNKIYPGPVVNKEKSTREYLDLFINSRLKIEEAYQRKYDTAASFLEEINTLRRQVMDNYMTDPESFNTLLNEAFDRSQKDIKVQHIFIPYKAENNVSDSAMAKLKILQAFMELISGKNFQDVALKFSADPSVSVNKGNLGYITVFSLSYEFEDIVYNLSPGKFSSPYKSNFGYHIFKVIDIRKAVGKIKLAQILLAFAPESTQEEKDKKGRLADSLYKRLLKGDDIAKLSANFSDDYISAASGGQIPEFGIGTFDPVFENIAFSLPANGSISKPFITSHGYHIIKRISLTPPSFQKNKKTLDEIKVQLEKDNRINLTKERLYNRIISKINLKQAGINQTILQAYADSVLDFKQPGQIFTINNETVLFEIGTVVKTIGDLMTYAQSNRPLLNGAGIKSFATILDEFKQQTVFEYYRIHMEEFNEEFRLQMNDLKDGNLFFDIMMKEVWSTAQNDTLGQVNFYTRNKNKYIWAKSAGAVIFYCGDELTAQNLHAAVIKNPSNWKSVSETYGDRSTIDSGRYELPKIPGLKKMIARPGLITAVEKNNDDNSASFAYILSIFNQPAQKIYAEAKGDVITDYQNDVDARWTEELRKKYQVKMNEEVLKSILK